jgi:hypothetical protein
MTPVRTCAAALTAALLGLALTARAPGADTFDGMKYMPDDTNLFLSLRLAELVGTEAFQKWRKEIPDFDKEFDLDVRREFGVNVSDVEEMTFAGDARSSGVTVIILKKPTSAADVMKVLSQPGDNVAREIAFEEVKVGAFTIHQPDGKAVRADRSFCLAHEKALVVGETKTLEAVLKRNELPKLSAGLKAAAKEADFKGTVCILWDMEKLTSLEKPPPIPGVDTAAIWKVMTGMALTVNVGKDVKVRGAVVCKDEAGAAEVKKQTDAGLKAVADLMEKLPQKPPKELLDLPGKFRTATKGNVAEATATVSAEAADAFIKWTFVARKAPAPPDPKPAEDKKPIKKER